MKSLYPNIPQTEGIKTNIEALIKYNNLPLQKNATETLFNFVLKYNIFSFANKTYRQVHGTAIGTKLAPAYANIFLDHVETPFLKSIKYKPILYKRYIDDIFMLWPWLSFKVSWDVFH